MEQPSLGEDVAARSSCCCAVSWGTSITWVTFNKFARLEATEGCCLFGAIPEKQQWRYRLSIDVFWGFHPLLQSLATAAGSTQGWVKQPEPLTFRVLKHGPRRGAGSPGGFSCGKRLQPRSRCAQGMLWASGKTLSLCCAARGCHKAGGAVRCLDQRNATALP